MADLDYRILYREQLSEEEIKIQSADWTLFVSAFNTSDRVTHTFDICQAETKHWIVHPEYGFGAADLPEGAFLPNSRNEAEFWREYLDLSGVDLVNARVCVDATGFMRPHLAFLMALFANRQVSHFEIIYSDPIHYTRQEKTQFTKGPVTEVRQIRGFEGVHNPSTTNDLLIIGIGYDDELISRIAQDKANARKAQLFGLPSLEPDMYQQSVIRADGAAEAVGAGDADRLFAPANDPFVTAQVLRERVAREEAKEPVSNLYLASVGTKPQMLGFALYFLTERRSGPTSLIFPYASSYSQETTQGIARTWHFQIEFLNQ